MAELFGILNITEDSFSDGGKYLPPTDAIQKGTSLLQEGADYLEVSGQSSNTEATLISDDEEWARVSPVISHFVKLGIRISLDSFKPSVQKLGLTAGVRIINDITGFTQNQDPKFWKDHFSKPQKTKLIVMHSHNKFIAKMESNLTRENVIKKIQIFFRDRRSELVSWGVPESAIYFDPGMGFFLSPDPAVSFEVINQLDLLKLEFPHLMVSVSRKSFLGNSLGGLPVSERESITLACELFLIEKKIPYIRTHNVLQLRQAERIWNLCKLH
jgi:dihydropteroate synthase